MRIQKDVCLSIVLGIAIVGGGLWLLARSMSIPTPAMQKTAPPSGTITDRPKTSLLGKRQPEGTDSDPEAVHPRVAHGIRKCIVNGKTIYSDTECPAGAQTETVVLHDSGGIISPPKADLLMLMAQRKAAERQNTGHQGVLTMGTPQSASEECALLDQHVQYLDSKARQPQSSATQDWIRQERSKVRNRQVALHC